MLQFPVDTKLCFHVAFTVAFCRGALPPGATSPEGAGYACRFSSSAVTEQYLPGHSVSFPVAYLHDKPPLLDGQLLRDFLLLIDTD